MFCVLHVNQIAHPGSFGGGYPGHFGLAVTFEGCADGLC